MTLAMKKVCQRRKLPSCEQSKDELSTSWSPHRKRWSLMLAIYFSNASSATKNSSRRRCSSTTLVTAVKLREWLAMRHPTARSRVRAATSCNTSKHAKWSASNAPIAKLWWLVNSSHSMTVSIRCNLAWRNCKRRLSMWRVGSSRKRTPRESSSSSSRWSKRSSWTKTEESRRSCFQHSSHLRSTCKMYRVKIQLLIVFEMSHSRSETIDVLQVCKLFWYHLSRPPMQKNVLQVCPHTQSVLHKMHQFLPHLLVLALQALWLCLQYSCSSWEFFRCAIKFAPNQGNHASIAFCQQ